MIRWFTMALALAAAGAGAGAAQDGALAADSRVLDIAVKGMSCPFCVYNVEKKLGAVTGVARAEVDLGQGRARLVMEPGGQTDIDALRQAIIDAGFTPGEVSLPADDAAR